MSGDRKFMFILNENYKNYLNNNYDLSSTSIELYYTSFRKICLLKKIYYASCI